MSENTQEVPLGGNRLLPELFFWLSKVHVSNFVTGRYIRALIEPRNLGGDMKAFSGYVAEVAVPSALEYCLLTRLRDNGSYFNWRRVK